MKRGLICIYKHILNKSEKHDHHHIMDAKMEKQCPNQRTSQLSRGDTQWNSVAATAVVELTSTLISRFANKKIA